MGETSDWVNLCIKLFWALAFAISSIQLTHLVVLDGASKDTQNPSFTLFFMIGECWKEARSSGFGFLLQIKR